MWIAPGFVCFKKIVCVDEDGGHGGIRATCPALLTYYEIGDG